jgi:hypothetical protein
MATYNILKEAKLYLATNDNVESGLTVSDTVVAKAQKDGSGGFHSSVRALKTFMAGEVVLPATFSNTAECLSEHGGSGQGYWIGVTTDDGVKNFHFRVGEGSVDSNAQVQSTNRIYKKIPISQIPEFDGKQHTVAWEFDPPNNTAKLWIDNRLLISESISALAMWSGGNFGGWLKGFDSIAGFGAGSEGNPYRTEWSGEAGSDLRVYTDQNLTYTNLPLLLDVEEDVTFSQSFNDQTYKQRTLHNLHKLHDASNIKKANEANFEFTIPALIEDDLQTVVDHLVDFDSSGHSLKTFILYATLSNDTYLLEKCVITNGTFIIEKLENLKLTIAGQASRLSRGVTMPSTVTSRSLTRTFQKVDYLEVSIDGTSLTQGVTSVSVELQNDIKWLPYETVNDALNASNATTSMYPSNFTLEKRILSGSVEQFVLSNFNSDVQTWETGVNVVIKAGKDATNGWQFNLSNCSFTNRNTVKDVFTQNYDWIMNDNPTDLGSKITFNANT